MAAIEIADKTSSINMGKLRGRSLDGDYIFMQPSSTPAVRCAKTCFDPNKTQDNTKNDHDQSVLSRSVKTSEPSIQSSLYNMIDMSELCAPREEPVVTREIVTPPKAKNPPKDGLSCSLFHHSRPNSAQQNQKFVFPSNQTEVNKETKHSSPLCCTQRRAMRMVKCNNKGCSGSRPRDGADVYMEMMGRVPCNYMNHQPKQQQTDVNENLRSTEIFNQSYSMFATDNNSFDDRQRCSKSFSDSIYTDVCDYENYFEDCDAEQCDSISSNQSSENSPRSSQNIQGFTTNVLAQRRLPPRPVPEPVTSADARSNRLQRRPSIPENPPPLPPTNENFPSSSLVNEQHPSRRTPNVMTRQVSESSLTLQSQSSEPPTSKLSTLKSKTSALFSKNLISKSNLFNSKTQKQEKANECEYSCSDCNEKKSETQSPKLFRKTHPIAEMIKRRKNAIQAGFFGGSNSNTGKNNVSPPSNSKFKHPSVLEKKTLASVHSLPLLTASKVSPPTTSKVLASMKSSPNLVTEQTNKATRSQTEGRLIDLKTSPRPQKPVGKETTERATNSSSPNQSFLYRRGSDIRFDDKPTVETIKVAPKPPLKPKVARSHTFDGISADSLIAESYEVPFYLQEYSNVDDSPVLNSIDSDVFAFSPKPHLSPNASSDKFSSPRVLEKQQNSQINQANDNQSQFEKLRSNFSKAVSVNHFSFHDENGTESDRNATNSTARSQHLATRSTTSTPTITSPTAKENEYHARPPPPSLQKIREARLRKNWNNGENRAYNENLLTSNLNRVPAAEARKRAIERSKHLSNPDLPPSPEEDMQYSVIPECSQNSANSGNKLKLSRNKSLGAAASTANNIKTRMGRAVPHQSRLKTGGSVESFESDLSLRDDIDNECIYEDIADTFFPSYNKQPQ